jgi:hypothetical protein
MNSYYEGEPIPDYTTEGYFTGGPTGEIFLQIDNGFSWKLSNGKEIIIPQEVRSAISGAPSDSKIVDSIPVDNPEAFSGWAD